MSKKLISFINKAILPLIIFSLISGCATISSSKAIDAKKGASNLQFSAASFSIELHDHGTDFPAFDEPRIRKVIREKLSSEGFRNISQKDAPSEGIPHFHFRVHQSGSDIATGGSRRVASASLLFIFPYYESFKFDYDLNVILNQQEMVSVSSESSIYRMTWLPLFPIGIVFSPKTVMNIAVDGQIKDLISHASYKLSNQ